MKNNFFRKDLNLNSRWWHRLLLVIFFVLFIWALYVVFGTISYTNHPNVPQWKVTNSVEERITSEVKQIRELKMPDERVEQKDRSYALNLKTDDSLYDDIYCSSDLGSRINDVQNKSGIRTLYIRDVYSENNVPIEVFADYIKENNIECLLPDAYTKYNVSGQEAGKLRFLEPLRPDSLLYKDLVFYKKSNILTVFYVFKSLLLITAIFAVVVILYYKVLLYIIFGSKKN